MMGPNRRVAASAIGFKGLVIDVIVEMSSFLDEFL